MTITTGIIAFILIWWLVIFTVLPMGVERDPDPQLGNMTGAPKEHQMKKKVIVTTLIAAVIWGVLYGLIQLNIIDFYDIAREMMEDDLG